MNNPTIVFDPDAGADQRDIVQTIVDNYNVAITGHAEWYPVVLPQGRKWRGIGRFARRYLGGLATREKGLLWPGLREGMVLASL
jgi:hypothetical protein